MGPFQNLSAEMARIRDDARLALRRNEDAEHLSAMVKSKEAECEKKALELKDAQVKLRQLETDIHNLEVKNQELERAFDNSRADKTQISDLQRQLQANAELLDCKSSELGKSQEELQQVSERAVRTENGLRRDIQQLQAEADLAQQRFKMTEQDFERRIETVRTQAEGAASLQETELRQSFQSHEKNVQVLQEKISHANRDIGTLSAQKAAAEGELQKTTECVKELQAKYADLSKRYEILLKEENQTNTQMQASREREKDLVQQIEVARANTRGQGTFQEEVKYLTTELAKARSELEEERAQSLRKTKETGDLQLKLNKETNRVMTLEKQVSVKKAKYEDAMDVISAHTREKEKSEGKLRELRDSLEAEREAHLVDTRKLEEQKASNEMDAETRKANLDKLTQKFETCCKENSELRERLESHTVDQEKEQELVDASKQIKALQEKLEAHQTLPLETKPNGMQWTLEMTLPFDRWKTWDGYIRRFLKLNDSYLDAKEREEIVPIIEGLGGALGSWNTALQSAYHCIESLAAREKWHSIQTDARRLGQTRQVVVQSPALPNGTEPLPISVETEKERRRHAEKPTPILKNSFLEAPEEDELHPNIFSVFLSPHSSALQRQHRALEAPPVLSAYHGLVEGRVLGSELRSKPLKRSSSMLDKLDEPESKRTTGHRGATQGTRPVANRRSQVSHTAKKPKISRTYGSNNKGQQKTRESQGLEELRKGSQSQEAVIEAVPHHEENFQASPERPKSDSQSRSQTAGRSPNSQEDNPATAAGSSRGNMPGVADRPARSHGRSVLAEDDIITSSQDTLTQKSPALGVTQANRSVKRQS